MQRPAREALNALLVALGILSAAFGLKGFLLSSRFIDGGVTGVSMLLSDVLGAPLALLIPVINLPFIVLGGFFIGAGIGLAIRGGAVLDGTEVAALLVSKGSSLPRVGDVILILNVFIFSAAAFFLGVESALYSILTYFAASKTVDFLLHGIEQYTAVVVVSEQSEGIRQAIIRDLARGVTVYKGRRGWSDSEQDILYCVVTRLEIGRVRTLIEEFDPSAFIVVYPLTDVHGGVIKKTAHH